MIRKLQCILLTLAIGSLIVSPAFAESSFPDVDEHEEYAEAVEYLNDIGIMQGDTNGNFNPNSTVTRAQMAAIICRMLDETENLTTDDSRFTDVPTSHWANGYIVKAASLGIISGYQDGSFKPNDPVTYEQAVKMVVSAAGFSAEAAENGGYPDGFLAVADNNGFLTSISSEKGTPFTRSNVAILLYNYFNYNV
jgi:hypothetical protein